MIFTECPYCEEPQAFAWECGDGSGWFPSRCHECEKVMWVEATSLGGYTISHEAFCNEVMRDGDEEKIQQASDSAICHSTVVYDENETL